MIVISAMDRTLDKIEAFASGAVDYITKPFQFEEVEARVQTHLSLRQLQLDLEQRYEELHELEALRDSLTHMIVHDLRAPLAGVKGHLEFLQMGADQLSDDAKNDVDVAMQCTQVLMNMINSLLDVNRMESGAMPLKLEDCDLEVNAKEALASLGGLVRSHHVSIDVPGEAVVARCDADLIQRVIANLVANAIKFTPEKGNVRLKVTQRRERARVSIEDTGPGVPEEYRDKIFEKFGQVQARQNRQSISTGLGLAFCKLAVEAHSGTIGVDSVVGEGSTFWFELPLSDGSGE